MRREERTETILFSRVGGRQRKLKDILNSSFYSNPHTQLWSFRVQQKSKIFIGLYTVTAFNIFPDIENGSERSLLIFHLNVKTK